MRRRQFLVVPGVAALTWPRAGATQNRPWRLGLLGEAPDYFWNVLLSELRDKGYTEGTDFLVQYGRVDGNYDLLPQAAEKLVHDGADLIVASGYTAAHAARAVTSAVPIVFIAGADPVAGELVESLARPGGNVTGIASLGVVLNPKRLELLQELLPGVTQIAVLGNAASSTFGPAVRALEEAARVRGLTLRRHEVANPADIPAAIATIAGERSRGFIVVPSQMLFREQKQIANLAMQFKLAAVSADRDFVAAGGLASYAPNFPEMYRLAAEYVVRIRKGLRPGDIPIEQPTRFELIINAKTAKAIDVELPPTVLARADEVIE